MTRRWLLALALAASASASAATPVRVGFVIHFDCIENKAEARQAVANAAENGAEVVSIVPPAHVWENATAVEMLDTVVSEATRRGLQIIFARIDAAFPRDRHGVRENYLYAQILIDPGRLPDGRRSADFFLTTAGRPGYGEWMEEETRYYARHYGGLPNLIGISVGPFVEPFASERGGFLQYVDRTQHYELTQYTPETNRLWHEWLAEHVGDIAAVNGEYDSRFASADAVPLPRSDEDHRFGRPQRAYFDLVRTLNDWFLSAYERCRRAWHEESGRADVPYILQFSALEGEKIAKGRRGLAAFDLPHWIDAADAVGLSLYSNGGYADRGHSGIEAMVRFAGLARREGKDAFVLESGYEAPNVLADAGELQFLARAPRALSPRTFIYEFLRDKFDEQYRANPGKLFRADGRARPAAVRAVREAFVAARQGEAPPPAPALRVIVNAAATRDDRRLALLANALFDLATVVDVQWTTNDKQDGEGPLVRLDASLQPTDALRTALLAVPEPGDKRVGWCREVARLLAH